MGNMMERMFRVTRVVTQSPRRDVRLTIKERKRQTLDAVEADGAELLLRVGQGVAGNVAAEGAVAVVGDLRQVTIV